MATFDKKDLQRFAVSTVGAILLSVTCVFAAVGPVHAQDFAQSAKAGNLTLMHVTAK